MDEFDQRGAPCEADEGAVLITEQFLPDDCRYYIHYSRPRHGNAIVKRLYRAPAHCINRLKSYAQNGLAPMTVSQRIQFILDGGGTFIDEEADGSSPRFTARQRTARPGITGNFNDHLPSQTRRFGAAIDLSMPGEEPAPPTPIDEETARRMDESRRPPPRRLAYEQQYMGTFDPPVIDDRGRPRWPPPPNAAPQNPCLEVEVPIQPRQYSPNETSTRSDGAFCLMPSNTRDRYCGLLRGHLGGHNDEAVQLGRIQPEVLPPATVQQRLREICGRTVDVGEMMTARAIAAAINEQVPGVQAICDNVHGVVAIRGLPRSQTAQPEPTPEQRQRDVEQLYADHRVPLRTRQSRPIDPSVREAIERGVANWSLGPRMPILPAPLTLRDYSEADVRATMAAHQALGPLMHVHDEIVVEVPRSEEEGRRLANAFMEEMARMPPTPMMSVRPSATIETMQPVPASPMAVSFERRIMDAQQQLARAMQVPAEFLGMPQAPRTPLPPVPPAVVAETGPAQENPYEWEGGTVELYDESHAHQQEEPIYSWEVMSDRVSKAGRRARYTLVLYKDGCASCDCPGWINKRSGKPRGCKHIDRLAAEIQETHRRYLRGETLELLETPSASGPVPQSSPRREDGTPQPIRRYGRVVDV